jgi:hypothetical protein
MSPPIASRGACAAPIALAALALGACGSTVSTSGFKGEQHAVAQTASDLQADATAGDQKKVCTNDLSAAVVARLGGRAACERVIKKRLSEIENLDVTIESIKLAPGASTATAGVKSTYAGKKRTGTVTLVKEGGRWKVSAL